MYVSFSLWSSFHSIVHAFLACIHSLIESFFHSFTHTCFVCVVRAFHEKGSKRGTREDFHPHSRLRTENKKMERSLLSLYSVVCSFWRPTKQRACRVRGQLPWWSRQGAGGIEGERQGRARENSFSLPLSCRSFLRLFLRPPVGRSVGLFACLVPACVPAWTCSIDRLGDGLSAQHGSKSDCNHAGNWLTRA